MAITFRQYLIEDEPIVHHLANYPIDDTNHQHIFTVKHHSLKKELYVVVDHNRENNHGTINVHDENENTSHMGNLGHRNVLHVLRKIKHHTPDIETIGGHRVTGSRANKEKNKQVTAMSFKHIKPIAE